MRRPTLTREEIQERRRARFLDKIDETRADVVYEVEEMLKVERQSEIDDEFDDTLSVRPISGYMI